MSLPGSLLPNLNAQFCDDNGVPLANGSIQSYETGGTTPKALYADAGFNTELDNPANFDSDGRLVGFMAPGGYDFIVYDGPDGTGDVVFTRSNVEDVGATFLGQLGVELAQPVATSRTSGYTIVTTDTLVLVDSDSGSDDPCVINLSTVADHPLPVTIKNLGGRQVEIRPNGTETLENVNAYYYLPAASSPTLPSVLLVNDGVAGWWTLGALGL